MQTLLGTEHHLTRGQQPAKKPFPSYESNTKHTEAFALLYFCSRKQGNEIISLFSEPLLYKSTNIVFKVKSYCAA